MAFPDGSAVKNPPANSGDAAVIPELGRSPEKEMTTLSSILAWEIPWVRGVWQATYSLWWVTIVRHDLASKQHMTI